MEKMILFQNTPEIEYQKRVAHSTAALLTEKVLEISDMIGTIPTMEDLHDFYHNGRILHEKLEAATLADAKKFLSSSARRAFEVALEEEKSRLTGIRIDFNEALSKHRLHPGIFNLDDSGRLTVKESCLREIIEQNTIRATEGSPRFKIFQFAQTANEAIEELRKALLENGVNLAIPVSIPIDAHREGIIYSNEHNDTTIQHELFEFISDEVLGE